MSIRYAIEPAKPWQTSFKIELDLDRGLSGREQAILFHSARLCEVSKLLAGEFAFEYHLASASFGRKAHFPVGGKVSDNGSES